MTTVPPASFADGVSLRVAIGGDGAWLGDEAGGIGYLDSFTNSRLVNTVYVFSKNLANGNAKFVAEAASHEAGHGFGLDHQGLYSGTRLIDEYNPGPDGLRGPIMGDSYDAVRGVWWAGSTSESVYVFQDDLNMIARPINGFGYRADDHANVMYTATELSLSGTTVNGSGVIGLMSDVDQFWFKTAGGVATISVVVPGAINNLDARLELRNAYGAVIASASPGDSFNATVSLSLPAGRRRAEISWRDNSGNETGFVVQRSSDGVNWVTAGPVGANATLLVDGSLARNQTYYYRVFAVNQAGYSVASETASVRTPSRGALPSRSVAASDALFADG